MIDDQLAATLEQIGKGLPAVRRVEDIFLLDLDPGQCPPLGAQLVAPVREFLLLGEQSRARGKPFLAGHDLGRFHAVLLSSLVGRNGGSRIAAPIDRNVDIN